MTLWAPSHFAVLLLALALDAALGEPDWLYRRVPHPVVAMGRAIARLEGCLNRDRWPEAVRRAAGLLAMTALLAPLVAAAWGAAEGLGRVPGGWLIEGALASTLIAQRSLHTHISAVATGLDGAGLDGGRRAIARLVGRDPESLDRSGVCRAAIESCAENFSDGVAAPVFWYALLGLPGLVAYKAINTADSMIGHRNAKYQAFGWAAARIDDLANLVPARLSGLIVAAAAVPEGRNAAALNAMWRDASKHRSVNAGWPEAAMAGALGLALAGPRTYGREVIGDAWMGAGGRADATAADVRSAVRVLTRSCAVVWLLVGGAAVASMAI